MYQAGLVLEGGSMKGVYTAGVLDYFLEQDISFANSYGVSMGACALCSFVSRQKGRALATIVDHLDKKEYCGWYPLLTTGDIFNAKLCYDTIPNVWNPYDYESAEKYPGKYYAVLTDVETGAPVYYEIKDLHKDIVAIQASSSMPLVSNMVEMNGKMYLDGGISDAIPIKRSIQDGNQKNIVILTKEVGYYRKPEAMMPLMRLKYRNQPQVIKDMELRHRRYNRTMSFLEREEALGNIFVIRPQQKSGVGRIEKDPVKLFALHREGYEDAKRLFDDMIAYLEK